MPRPVSYKKTLNVLHNVSQSFKSAKQHLDSTSETGTAVSNILDTIALTKNTLPTLADTGTQRNYLRQNLTHLSKQLRGDAKNSFGPAQQEYKVTARPTKRLCKNAAQQLSALAKKL